MTKDSSNQRKSKESVGKQGSSQKSNRIQTGPETQHSLQNHEKPKRQGDFGKGPNSEEGKIGFERGTLVWVRIKGFPWWPGIFVHESDVPEKLKKVRAL